MSAGRWALGAGLWAIGVLAAACAIRVPPAGAAADEGEGIACDTSDDCPYPESSCLLSQCLDGACVYVPAPEGPLPLEEQKPGDCKQLYCDGNGRVSGYPAPMDEPPEDDNPCTRVACDMGNPVSRAAPAGQPCPNGVCNGKGRCGSCTPDEQRCEGHAVAQCTPEGEWRLGACSGARPVCSGARCVGVVEIAAGAEHGCARFEDGTVRCWGAGPALGTGGLAAARAPAWEGRYVEVTVGPGHGCGREPDGSIACWGRGEHGQLGDGGFQSSADPVAATIQDAVELCVGARHSCARTAKGEVHCWGDNERGQLGSGKPGGAPRVAAPPRPSEATPIAIAGLADAKELAAAGEHTCVKREGGHLACWGAIEPPLAEPDGGTTTPPRHAKAEPTWVVGIKDVAEIACGAMHSCARTQQGVVYCWGAGEHGQLGDGTRDSATPLIVKDLGAAQRIELGGDFGCALLEGGRLSCWGGNAYGQLGRGTASPHGGAALVEGLSGVTQLVLGDRFACALDAARRLVCWGHGAGGGASKPTALTW